MLKSVASVAMNRYPPAKIAATEPSSHGAASGRKATHPTASATTGTANKKYNSSSRAVAITVAKLRPQLKPLRCKMNEATALPPTTEGVSAEANSQSRMLEAARFTFSSPLAKTHNRTT